MSERTGDRATAVPVPFLARTLPAVPESVPRIRRLLLSFAAAHGAGPRVRADIGLAVSEAVANAVAHAYPPGAAGDVHVAADVEAGTLEVVVADDGDGVRDTRSAGLGAGLGLIAATAAQLRLRPRSPQGTEVWMQFVMRAD